MQPKLPAGMRGTELRGSGSPGAFRSAPRRALSGPAVHCSPERLQAVPARSRRLAAAFRSSATTARFQATIAESTFPACRFAAMPTVRRDRSTSGSTARTGLHPARAGS